MRIVLVVALILMAGSNAFAQTRDVCHAYVVDVTAAKAASDAKAMAAAQTVFPEFYPTIGEEELTTKTYPLPRSSLVITASVYYTDESMASAAGSDSMLVGILISPKAEKDALSSPQNAVAEVTQSSQRSTVRVKKYLDVQGRLYLVGVECRCNEPAAAK
jgi:uncharacterized membrane protein affecting hemolysin expression